MSYRNDQFYNSSNDTSRGRGDNPPFMYPGGAAHTLTSGGQKSVQRGFIRSLVGSNSAIWKNLNITDTNIINSPEFNSKMWFQFNPTQILQAVQMSESATIPMLMDAGQLTQPIPGNQTISFDILLDRQMEMQGKTKAAVNSPVNSQRDLEANITTNINTSNDPADIGVMADLKVLYGIIGQGLSDNQISLYNAIQDRATATKTDTSTAASVAATTPQHIKTTGGNVNAGNFSFLVPLPVRVLFSSLFMVDGFITSSSILYTKFNANMVPMQCTVTLSMQAVYFGFARQDTLLTQKLETAKPVSATPSEGNSIQGTSDKAKSLVTKLGNSFGSLTLMLADTSETNARYFKYARIQNLVGFSSAFARLEFSGLKNRTINELYKWVSSGAGTFSLSVNVDAVFTREQIQVADYVGTTAPSEPLTLTTFHIDLSNLTGNSANTITDISGLDLLANNLLNPSYNANYFGNIQCSPLPNNNQNYKDRTPTSLYLQKSGATGGQDYYKTFYHNQYKKVTGVFTLNLSLTVTLGSGETATQEFTTTFTKYFSQAPADIQAGRSLESELSDRLFFNASVYWSLFPTPTKSKPPKLGFLAPNGPRSP